MFQPRRCGFTAGTLPLKYETAKANSKARCHDRNVGTNAHAFRRAQEAEPGNAPCKMCFEYFDYFLRQA
jgi:hypothetical protein